MLNARCYQVAQQEVIPKVPPFAVGVGYSATKTPTKRALRVSACLAHSPSDVAPENLPFASHDSPTPDLHPAIRL